MLYDLHGLALNFESNAELIRERLAATFSSRRLLINGDADISFYLQLVESVTPAPQGAPVYTERDLIHYYIEQPIVTAYLPRYGQLQINLERATIEAKIIPSVITTYGVFEDLIAIGLSPLLRRRGKFFIHAFAASYNDCAALLVGGIGAGKTTTGISLVRAGWKLLSNDSPLFDAATLQVLSYPGLFSAYRATLQRFPELHSLIPASTEHAKVTFAAESIYPDVWQERASPGVILFPHIENIREHQVELLSPPDALRRLLPHAVERWDVELIPRHLALLNQIVAQTPAYSLALAPAIESISALLCTLL